MVGRLWKKKVKIQFITLFLLIPKLWISNWKMTGRRLTSHRFWFIHLVLNNSLWYFKLTIFEFIMILGKLPTGSLESCHCLLFYQKLQYILFSLTSIILMFASYQQTPAFYQNEKRYSFKQIIFYNFLFEIIWEFPFVIFNLEFQCHEQKLKRTFCKRMNVFCVVEGGSWYYLMRKHRNIIWENLNWVSFIWYLLPFKECVSNRQQWQYFVI